MMIESRLLGMLAILLLSPTRERDEHHWPITLLVPQLAGQFVAAVAASWAKNNRSEAKPVELAGLS
jgi:hypothetical protein